jgi:hypothetical protein
MRLSAKRENAFHWSSSEDSTFRTTKLIAALMVASGSYYVFQLWAPDAPPLSTPQTIAREVQQPPSSVAVRLPLPTDEPRVQTQIKMQPEPASQAPARHETLISSPPKSHRSATYQDLRDQFLSDLGQ